MNIQNTFTVGHKVSTSGSKTVYQGTTTTEGLAIGQKVSDRVKTEVDLGDKVVIKDLDRQPNLAVGFQQYADGTRLCVSNSNGEFETSTAIPVKVAKSEVERGADLTDGFDVHKVTVEQRPKQGTFISMADTSGIGERTVLVTPDGKLQFFLREA